MIVLHGTENIIYCSGSLNAAEEYFSLFKKTETQVFILTDQNVYRDCYDKLIKECPSLSDVHVIILEAGEKNKDFKSVSLIIESLQRYGADRTAVLINFGGGMICDTGGFAASVYKRGIRFVNIPTTLLAMVDAAIGGKTGINFGDVKNVIGTFTHPEKIIIDIRFLETLPGRQLRSGVAEMIKHALLLGGNEWNVIKELLHSGRKINENDIRTSADFKNAVVSEDFHEQNKRYILNFGHTIGHAFESFSIKNDPIPLLHGEAIAAGMVAEIFLSSKIFSFPEEKAREITEQIADYFHDIKLSAGDNDLSEFLVSDKKNKNQRIGFSLLSDIGNPKKIFFPEKDDIISAIRFSLNIFSRR
jgi:3-dehydroquinate synthase